MCAGKRYRRKYIIGVCAGKRYRRKNMIAERRVDGQRNRMAEIQLAPD